MNTALREGRRTVRVRILVGVAALTLLSISGFAIVIAAITTHSGGTTTARAAADTVNPTCAALRAQFGPGWPCISVPNYTPTTTIPTAPTAPGAPTDNSHADAGVYGGPGPGVGNGTPIVPVPGGQPAGPGIRVQTPTIPASAPAAAPQRAAPPVVGRAPSAPPPAGRQDAVTPKPANPVVHQQLQAVGGNGSAGISPMTAALLAAAGAGLVVGATWRPSWRQNAFAMHDPPPGGDPMDSGDAPQVVPQPQPTAPDSGGGGGDDSSPSNAQLMNQLELPGTVHETPFRGPNPGATPAPGQQLGVGDWMANNFEGKDVGNLDQRPGPDGQTQYYWTQPNPDGTSTDHIATTARPGPDGQVIYGSPDGSERAVQPNPQNPATWGTPPTDQRPFREGNRQGWMITAPDETQIIKYPNADGTSTIYWRRPDDPTYQWHYGTLNGDNNITHPGVYPDTGQAHADSTPSDIAIALATVGIAWELDGGAALGAGGADALGADAGADALGAGGADALGGGAAGDGILDALGAAPDELAPAIEETPGLETGGEDGIGGDGELPDRSPSIPQSESEPLMEGPQGSTAGGGTSPTDQTLDDALRPEKMNHVFVPKHNLDELIEEYGSQESVMREIINSLSRGSDIPNAGTFQVERSIGGELVTIRGAVVKGILRIGTVFVR